MSTCHRYAQQVGEYGPAQEYDYDERSGDKRRLSDLLLPNGGSALVMQCVPFLLVFSIVLCVCGVFFKTFRFKFLGIMGYVLGVPKNIRENSLITLVTSLPAHSINPNTFGIHWIEFFFIVFSGVMVVVFLVSLLILWMLP